VLVYAAVDDIIALLRSNVNTIKNNAEILESGEETGIGVNIDKTKYVCEHDTKLKSATKSI
jgi:hypothetical protein